MDSIFNYAERVRASGLNVKDSVTQLEVWHPDRKVGTQPSKIEWIVFRVKDGGIVYRAESADLAEKWMQERIGWHKSFKNADWFNIKKIVYWN
jgi:hypothetical protein